MFRASTFRTSSFTTQVSRPSAPSGLTRTQTAARWQDKVRVNQSIPFVAQRCMARMGGGAKVSSDRSRQLKAYFDSPGGITNLYVPSKSWELSLPWKIVKNWFQGAFAMRRMFNKLGTGAQKAFLAEVKDIYSTVQRGIAEGNMHAVEAVVTSSAMLKLSDDLSGQTRPKGMTYKWTLHEFLPPRIVSKRVFMVREMKDTEFVQLCVHIRSKQSLEVFDKNKKLIAGSPDPTVTNEYCVFERKLGPNTNWKYTGKLTPK